MIGFTFPHLRLINTSATLRLPEQTPAGSMLSSFAAGLVALWGAGTALLIGLLARDAFILISLLCRSVPLPAEFDYALRVRVSGSGLSERDAGTRNLGRKPIRILLSDRVRTACCFQLQTPTILIPRALLSMPCDDLVYVIRHEVAHLRFGHPLRFFVQRCAESIFWFHPAVWWASRQAVLTREFVCDEAAVSSKAEAARYLRALLQLIISPAAKGPSGALGIGNHRGLLADRAESLSRHQWSRQNNPLQRNAWIAVAGSVAMVAVLTLWIPIGNSMSFRSLWSPWPAATAVFLHAAGIPARDYEVDGHRFRPQELTPYESRNRRSSPTPD
ncbi:MAG: M56 family metallopeptidase [Planctomycetaceae bacterium]|nr:M56 family metallopeptidase [Planctomycetaceae bacterium]